jgi:hypothetical protein
MSDDQDVPMPVLQERVRVLTQSMAEMEQGLQQLRGDKLRIEGGKWVLWVMGGILVAGTGIYYSLSNSPGLRAVARLLGP